MSPVHKLSQMGSLTTTKTDYPSMLAGYGDFGALQRIAYSAPSSTNTVTFNNIPQTFQDLMVVAYVRSVTNNSTDALDFSINNVTTGTLYSATFLRGDGSTASSGRYSTNVGYPQAFMPGATATASIFGSVIWHILNYTNTSTFKTVLNRTAVDLNGSGRAELAVNLYRSTNAITRLDLFCDSGANFASGSTVALYGVRASAA